VIHHLLNLTRPLVVPDTETTGVDTQNDRIVELGLRVYDAGGLKSEWRSLIDPGMQIPPATTKVHGYTNEMMKGCRRCGQPEFTHIACLRDGSLGVHTDEQDKGRCIYCDAPSHEFKIIPRFSQIAEKLARGLTDCDFAGKNVRFDLRILSSEFARAGVRWEYASARIVDADRLEALLHPRDLSTLYRKYTGKELEGAHGALSDVAGSVEVICAQLEAPNTPWPPQDLDALHRLQWKNWIDPDYKFAFDDEGVPCFTRWGKHALRPMREVPVDYYDFILKSDFSPDVKRIAGEAKLGKFPERTA
jgi:DNA polymerase-3 subunit epsilon